MCSIRAMVESAGRFLYREEGRWGRSEEESVVGMKTGRRNFPAKSPPKNSDVVPLERSEMLGLLRRRHDAGIFVRENSGVIVLLL